MTQPDPPGTSRPRLHQPNCNRTPCATHSEDPGPRIPAASPTGTPLGPVRLVSLVSQELPMSLLGRPHVNPKVIAARRIKPLVPEQLLDMPDRTAIEQERRRHGMPEHVSGDLLPEVRPLRDPPEHALDGVVTQPPRRVPSASSLSRRSWPPFSQSPRRAGRAQEPPRYERPSQRAPPPALGTGIAATLASPQPRWSMFRRKLRTCATFSVDTGKSPMSRITQLSASRYRAIVKGARRIS